MKFKATASQHTPYLRKLDLRFAPSSCGEGARQLVQARRRRISTQMPDKPAMTIKVFIIP